MKSLSPEMLARMTQIDYDREMALVAIDRSADQEQDCFQPNTGTLTGHHNSLILMHINPETTS